MTYFVDLTGTNNNNYRIVKPNIALNQNTVNGTIDFGGAISDITEDFTGSGEFGSLTQNAFLPTVFDPLGGFGGGTVTQEFTPGGGDGTGNFDGMLLPTTEMVKTNPLFI